MTNKPAWVSPWLNAILEDQDNNEFRNEEELTEALELHESDNEYFLEFSGSKVVKQ